MTASEPRRPPLDWGIALVLVAVGVGIRLARLDLVVLNADTIGPYFRAWTLLDGQGLLPPPHAPESGPGLYWLSTLFVAGADSLQEMFARRYVLQGLLGAVAFLVARSVLPRAGALVLGAFLATSESLMLTLDSGYQGYLAPDLAVLVALGVLLAIHGRARVLAVALPVVPLAMMCHPFAVALLAPTLMVTAPALRSKSSRSVVAFGLVVAMALGVVRLVQLANSPGDGYLWEAATGNASGVGPAAVVWGSLRAVPIQDGLLTALALAAPILAVFGPDRPVRRMARVYVASVAALWLAGATIGYLQPYHHRILLPLAVATLSCVPFEGPTANRLVWGAAVVSLGLSLVRMPEVERVSDLEAHARLGERVAAEAGEAGRWVEFATAGEGAWGSPAALVLGRLLAGDAVERFREPGPLYLVVSGDSALVGRLEGVLEVVRPVGAARRSAALVPLAGPSMSVPWTRDACARLEGVPLSVERRAADWIAFVKPGYTDMFTRLWFDDCVVGGR